MTTLAESPVRFATDVLGITPHPGQAEWLSCRAPVKVACAGRRWGKSLSTSADLIWFGATRHGTQQFVVAPTHDQSTIIFRYVTRLLADSRIAGLVDKIVYSPFPEIQLGNGSVIRARSAGSDGTNLRGHGADRIILDEAAFIGEPVYETITPILATSDYGEMVLISTPFGRNTFFNYWQRGQRGDPDIRSFRFPSDTNPHLSPSYLEQQRRDMTSLAYRVEYEAEFAEDQNAVFPYPLIDACAVDTDDTPAPAIGHSYVLGWDPAKWVDRSGVVVLDVTAKPWRVVRCLDISGRDLINQQWPRVKALSSEFRGARILLDSTHDESLLEFARSDMPNRVEGFGFTNPSKQELINNLVLEMEQGNLLFPRYPALLEELLYYRYELTAAGNVRLGADSRHHDDLVTALALAVQQAGAARGPLGNRVAVSAPRAVVSYQPR